MTRDFKFRVWHEGSMVFAGQYPIRYVWFDNEPWDETIHGNLMQYTGLKDKNGKELYEGDIINFDAEFTCDGEPLIRNTSFTVEWMIDGYIIIELPYILGACRFFRRLRDIPMEYIGWGNRLCTIIGNIYENPELCLAKVY